LKKIASNAIKETCIGNTNSVTVFLVSQIYLLFFVWLNFYQHDKKR